MHFSAQARKIKKIHSEEISYIPGKWNILSLILKNFLYFFKRKLLLYFRKLKPRKDSLYFLQESFSFVSKNGNPELIFFIFQKRKLSYISRNGNAKKPLIFQEVTFRDRKIKETRSQKFSYISWKWNFLALKNWIKLP